MDSMPQLQMKSEAYIISASMPKDARCLHCGYLLRDLIESRCPECGETFDPRNPATYASPRKSMTYRMARPPKRVHNMLMIAAAVYVLVTSSGPFHSESLFLCLATPLLACVVLGCGADYGQRRWATAIVSRDHPDYRQGPKPRPHAWLISPLCFALMVSALLFPWTRAIRFAISKPFLERAVQRLNAGQRIAGEMIGLYYISDTRVEPDGSGNLYYFEAGSSFIDPVGFEYNTNPFATSSEYHHRMARNWYTYED